MSGLIDALAQACAAYGLRAPQFVTMRRQVLCSDTASSEGGTPRKYDTEKVELISDVVAKHLGPAMSCIMRQRGGSLVNLSTNVEGLGKADWKCIELNFDFIYALADALTCEVPTTHIIKQAIKHTDENMPTPWSLTQQYDQKTSKNAWCP